MIAYLPFPERSQAVDRLLDILIAAEVEPEESMTLVALMAVKILVSYGIAPGTEYWRGFFRTLSECCANEMATATALQRPLQ